jgi:trehalose utilization protein
MGLVVLHSGHHSKLFRRLMGTNCNLAWRELPDGDLERIWVVNPSHPIATGLPPFFEVPQSEMYGEPFDIPAPDVGPFFANSKRGGWGCHSPSVRNRHTAEANFALAAGITL